jgi:sRNA-binding regulator protein Hfq
MLKDQTKPTKPAAPPPEKKPPRPEPAETMIVAALQERRALAFYLLDGKMFEGVPLSLGQYSIEVESEGERFAIFKHSVKMIRHPKLQG